MYARGRGPRVLLGIGFLLVGGAASVHAESVLRFPVPKHFGTTPAITHDADGKAIGKASMTLERTTPGTVRLVGTAAIDTGGSTRVQADFEIVDGGDEMKLVSQRSESITVEGRSLGVLLIEHEKGTATCTPPPDLKQPAKVLPLPETDRVANVPLHLFFAPLAQGKRDEMKFEVLLCREDPRFMEFEAWVADRGTDTDDSDRVEIRYRPDLGAVLELIAQAVIPDLRFWIDGTDKDRYLGHRMPLYSKGPEIWVIREGVDPADLQRPTPAHESASADGNGERQDEGRSYAPGR